MLFWFLTLVMASLRLNVSSFILSFLLFSLLLCPPLLIGQFSFGFGLLKGFLSLRGCV